MPWVEQWTRNGDHIPAKEVTEAEAARAEVEQFDDNSNISRSRVTKHKPS